MNGGTYTLVDPLIFTGDIVQVNSQFYMTGQAEVTNTGTLTVAPTGLIDVVGSIEMNTTENLKIDDVLNVYRLTMTPQAIALNTNVPTWQPVSPPCAGWVQKDVSAQFQISFPINLPVGDTIVDVTVRVDGGGGVGHSSLPAGADRLTVSLVQVGTDGAVTTLASRADQSGSVGAYDIPHSVTLTNGALDSGTMPRLVDDDFTYYVLVAGETGANSIANTTLITSIFGDCIARSYRSLLMTY